MAAVWLAVRAGLRTRWQAWLAVALVTGLAGGVATAVAAGARRTETAYPDLVAWSAPPDDLVSYGPGLGHTYANVSAAAVRKLPQVTAAGALDAFTALDPASIAVMAPVDGTVPGTFWHRKLLAGRLADPDRADEADISFTIAQAEHVAVGDTLRTTLLAADGKPVPFGFYVAGIVAAPGDFPPEYGPAVDFLWATPAFARGPGARLAELSVLALRLRRGAAGVRAAEGAISRLDGGKAVNDYPLGTQAVNTRQSIHLQSVALWLLTGLLALLGLLLVWQLLSRLTVLESAGFGGLRALGMSPAQLAGTGLARAGLIGAAGAVIAVIVAFAASALFPVGLAAVAEPHPGPRADWPVLAAGAAGVLAAVLGCAAGPAWRAARAASRPAAGPRARAGRLATVGLLRPVPVATGIRLALHRGAGRTAVPVASTMTASVVGVLGLAAALVFTASLGSLLAAPRHYGTDWDALVSDLSFGGSLAPAAASIGADPAVAQWTGSYGPLTLDVNGIPVGAVTTGPGPDGTLAAAPLAGRPPAAAGEIVLGLRTLAAAHARVGSTVTASVAGLPRRVPLLVTGTAVFPAFGDTTQLGTGAEVTVAGLTGLAPPGLQLPPYNAILVRFKAGASAPAGISALAARLSRVGPFAVTSPSTPADLVNFGQLEDLPLLLGLALGGLALLTLAHLLLTAVRRRRRDLAVLRALGFTGRQVRAAVSWMAVTLAVVALAAGVPAGIVCGRTAWLLFAGQLGIQPVTVLAPVPLAVLAAGGISAAVAVAAGPGLFASRLRPAAVLRAE